MTNLTTNPFQSWIPDATNPSSDPFEALRAYLVMAQQMYDQLAADGILPKPGATSYRTPPGLPPIPPLAPAVQPPPLVQDPHIDSGGYGDAQAKRALDSASLAERGTGGSKPQNPTIESHNPFLRTLWPESLSTKTEQLPQNVHDDHRRPRPRLRSTHSHSL